ncbi:hypothetical protein O9H85_29075 [Paenibacillus filicis]|uniref:Uncharacterized protein n=1 Tax=Paenibacillus gyeongsangnamensis TaxID=3388067 RepID=A0ABT4QHR2_9BACL|nr:hypothetical protein [Paenibacillus filicis]MCZ8516373.1 hypothetical protein [Paenibacillus filicis]
MSQSSDLVCPWCQTEIVWDPELGPEETCPHCFNELGEYRSIQWKVKPVGQSIEFDEDEDEEEENDEYYDDELEPNSLDTYEEAVQHVLDRQEEAPECPSCRSFMLLAGTQAAPESFVPFIHASVKSPLIGANFTAQVYVCPSCFKVDTLLSEKDRLEMIELLKQAK